MGIFIILNKYKAHQSVEKLPIASGDYLVSKLPALTIMPTQLEK